MEKGGRAMSTQAKGSKPLEAAREVAEIRSAGPPVTISAPNRRERAELLDVLAEAFLDNPMNVAIHGGRPERRLLANRAGLRSLVLRPADSAVVRVARLADRIVGGFVVIRPRGYPLHKMKLRDQIGCLFQQGWGAVVRWEQVQRALALSHPLEPHWYLAVLGVSSSQWGRGLGSQLVRELEALVEEQPASVYLESDRAESIRFYQRRGFEIRDEHVVFGVRCVCLERPAAFTFRGV
jgi:ribosomal protein S18 acetylase RimI-like enzyme